RRRGWRPRSGARWRSRSGPCRRLRPRPPSAPRAGAARGGSCVLARRVGVAHALTGGAGDEPVGLVAVQERDLAVGHGRTGPVDAVGDHAAHVGVLVDGVVLVAGAEVEDLALAAAEGAAGAEYLSPAEGGDEDQLIGHGDVEVLAVHLLLVDDDRVRDALGDGMG